jgi:hypothetical protein
LFWVQRRGLVAKLLLMHLPRDSGNLMALSIGRRSV